ncbi:hypothetical protein O0I10_011981 [Lichtheimia ornata]|uniref:Uncharacterized protein n=1 Tax=Lichtheimia ornata TaxID=688661 RepID=A0AAD7XTL6_9FUNG|nr:uncharacterized protein O0I10_011981 [Lichtheimia ornata]KAJ8652401.1 hypothetical protein O0I10_011981 [Lichtheimia ornata]
MHYDCWEELGQELVDPLLQLRRALWIPFFGTFKGHLPYELPLCLCLRCGGNGRHGASPLKLILSEEIGTAIEDSFNFWLRAKSAGTISFRV